MKSNRIASHPSLFAAALFVLAMTTLSSAQNLSCKIKFVQFPTAPWTTADDLSDNAGMVVGFYTDSSGSNGHGFLFQNGQYSTIDYPGAVATSAVGTNHNGDIVGWYTTPDLLTSGFLLSNGNFTSITVPGETYVTAAGINDNGDVVGTLGSGSAYVLSNGVVTKISYPGAQATYGNGINNQGDIVGQYYDAAQKRWHGFIDRGGNFTSITVGNSELTFSTSINNFGQVAGYYHDAVAGREQGFRWQNGHYQIVSDGNLWVELNGINDKGQLAGAVKKSWAGMPHGILAQCQ